jgi:hypothetical protein
MVLDVASYVPKLSGGISVTVQIILYTLGAIIALVIIGLFIWWIYSRRKWNLSVEFKLTRNDGRITNAEWGKGFYNSKQGVVFVKRPKGRAIPIKIFDIRRYIQGDRIITVLQVGPEDFRPILNDSWTEYIQTYKDDVTGEIREVKESILNIKVDSGLNKAWKSAWDSAAKNAYSIRSFLSQFQTPVAIGIVIICCFVGFAILWSKIK